jgi:hypothetical protein
MKFARCFAMPSKDTFSIPPIRDFVARYINDCHGHGNYSLDPFARNNNLCTWNNDIDPATKADSHMDAEEFCRSIKEPVALTLFDPPYSPRQISECYKGFGREVTTKDTQNSALYKRVRDAIDPLIVRGGIVLSFGWSSNGMGVTRGYELVEILLVAHGGAHNDTICIAEAKQ